MHLLEIINPGMQESHCRCGRLCFAAGQLKSNPNPCIGCHLGSDNVTSLQDSLLKRLLPTREGGWEVQGPTRSIPPKSPVSSGGHRGRSARQLCPEHQMGSHNLLGNAAACEAESKKAVFCTARALHRHPESPSGSRAGSAQGAHGMSPDSSWAQSCPFLPITRSSLPPPRAGAMVTTCCPGLAGRRRAAPARIPAYPQAQGPFQDTAAPRSTIKPVTFCSISFLLYSSQVFPRTKSCQALSISVSCSEERRRNEPSHAVPQPFRDAHSERQESPMGCLLSWQHWGKHAYRAFKERLNALTSPLDTEDSKSLAGRRLTGDATGAEHSTGARCAPGPPPALPAPLLPTLLHVLPLAFPQHLPPPARRETALGGTQPQPAPEEHPAKRSAPCQAASPG